MKNSVYILFAFIMSVNTLISSENTQKIVKSIDGYYVFFNFERYYYQLEIKGENIQLTPEGFIYADSLVLQFVSLSKQILPENRNYDTNIVKNTLLNHMNWEKDYVSTSVQNFLNVDTNFYEIGNRTFLRWNYILEGVETNFRTNSGKEDILSSKTYNLQTNISTVCDDYIINLNIPYFINQGIKPVEKMQQMIFSSLKKLDKNSIGFNEFIDSIQIKRLLHDFEKYKPRYLKQIKDSLSNSLIRDKAIPRLYKSIDIENLDYVIVPSLCLSERALNKDLSKGILEYLDIDTLHFRARAFVFDKGWFVFGPNLHFYCDPLPHYFHVAYIDKESKFYESVYSNDPEKTTHLDRYEFWSEYKCDLLFYVCGDYHSFWALKENKIIIFSLGKLKPQSFLEYYRSNDNAVLHYNSIIHKKEGFSDFIDTNYFYMGRIFNKDGSDFVKINDELGMNTEIVKINQNTIEKYLSNLTPIMATTKIDFCGTTQDHTVTIYNYELWHDGFFSINVMNPSPIGIPVIHNLNYFSPNNAFVITPKLW